MPKTSQKIRDQLNLDQKLLEKDELCFYINEGHRIGNPAPLFRRIEDVEINNLKKKYSDEPEVKVSKRAAQREAKKKKRLLK